MGAGQVDVVRTILLLVGVSLPLFMDIPGPLLVVGLPIWIGLCVFGEDDRCSPPSNS